MPVLINRFLISGLVILWLVFLLGCLRKSKCPGMGTFVLAADKGLQLRGQPMPCGKPGCRGLPWSFLAFKPCAPCSQTVPREAGVTYQWQVDPLPLLPVPGWKLGIVGGDCKLLPSGQS